MKAVIYLKIGKIVPNSKKSSYIDSSLPFDESLFGFVRSFERYVEFFILNAELLQTLFSHQFLQDL